MTQKIETLADRDVRQCLDDHQSFALIAGAGSGKTSSLVEALERIREREGSTLRQNGQRVACITFTKRAAEVIKGRLRFDDLFLVSTLHSFLWRQLSHFESDIRNALKVDRLPKLIAKEREKDNGGKSKDALEARAKAESYAGDLEGLDAVPHFEYREIPIGNYLLGQLSHDDVIAVASYLFKENVTFRRITGLRFPYILVDEAQDTFEGVVVGLNLVCEGTGLPIVGYFGDPWQQIYDASAGSFAPPANGKVLSKTENFRCSESVIRLLNSFRKDVQQYAAGENKGREGSVVFRLVRAEKPEMPRNRYSDEQIGRALGEMDAALTNWEWQDRTDIVRLFLARQMIARRMGFASLNRLFTGPYASTRAEEAFDQGEHFLVKPLTTIVHPLVSAHEANDSRQIIDVLRCHSPAFAVDGPNAMKSLKSMIETSINLVDQLAVLCKTEKIRAILKFCVEKQLVETSSKLLENLNREPRSDPYNEAIHSVEKGDWLADAFFDMNMTELRPYAAFLKGNATFSTQHGVKGEEYPKVLVVYDDVEASWNNYSFGKLLTPTVSGQPTEKQFARTQKLAYVSFSRALNDLRVLFFTPSPEGARDELISQGLLQPSQIEIA